MPYPGPSLLSKVGIQPAWRSKLKNAKNDLEKHGPTIGIMLISKKKRSKFLKFVFIKSCPKSVHIIKSANDCKKTKSVLYFRN